MACASGRAGRSHRIAMVGCAGAVTGSTGQRLRGPPRWRTAEDDGRVERDLRDGEVEKPGAPVSVLAELVVRASREQWTLGCDDGVGFCTAHNPPAGSHRAFGSGGDPRAVLIADARWVGKPSALPCLGGEPWRTRGGDLIFAESLDILGQRSHYCAQRNLGRLTRFFFGESRKGLDSRKAEVCARPRQVPCAADGECDERASRSRLNVAPQPSSLW
jgi:hypothetical protein